MRRVPVRSILVLALALASSLAPRPAVAASTRWASSVVARSSQYTTTSWAASQALGPPDVWPAHGDVATAWAPLTADGQREYLELGFDSPAPINYVSVFETHHPGAIDSVYAWNPVPGQYELLWAGVAAPAGDTARVWSATFPTTPYAVSKIRIAFNSPAVFGWNEVDAVAIGVDAIHLFVPQWASSATASSTYHPSGGFSAAQATGPPDVYPHYGDNGNAWASLTADGGREWLQLDYAQPVFVSGFRVYETFSPGAIDSIYLRRHDDGSLHLVYAATPSRLTLAGRVLNDTIATTGHLVDGVRITLASDVVPTWNEIDAVAIDVDSLLVPVPPAVASAPALRAPSGVTLAEARPSPFESSTTLAFKLVRGEAIRLALYDTRGARVRTLARGDFAAGEHEVRWNGDDDSGRPSPPGMYFVRLEAGSAATSRRVLRLR